MKKILIVEDEILIREEISIMLENAGYEVIKITEFNNTIEKILNYSIDLVLLDLNLPNESGFEICREIKKKSSLPVLVLTSRDQLKDEIKALKLGADEYITKPFRKERLLVRIENLFKRYEGRENLLEGDNFLLDRNTYTLYIDGNSVVLSQNHGKLLEALLISKGEVVTKEDLSMILWETTEYIDENALQVNITRLKKVMNEIGMNYKIKAVRGIGYKMLKEDK